MVITYYQTTKHHLILPTFNGPCSLKVSFQNIREPGYVIKLIHKYDNVAERLQPYNLFKYWVYRCDSDLEGTVSAQTHNYQNRHTIIDNDHVITTTTRSSSHTMFLYYFSSGTCGYDVTYRDIDWLHSSRSPSGQQQALVYSQEFRGDNLIRKLNGETLRK